MEEIEEILEKAAQGKKPKGPITIETLQEHHCRWPFGVPTSPDFHFCGKKKVTGKPYCEFHQRQAFTPPAPRRKQKEESVPLRYR